jgi:hypothetical protein
MIQPEAETEDAIAMISNASVPCSNNAMLPFVLLPARNLSWLYTQTRAIKRVAFVVVHACRTWVRLAHVSLATAACFARVVSQFEIICLILRRGVCTQITAALSLSLRVLGTVKPLQGDGHGAWGLIRHRGYVFSSSRLHVAAFPTCDLGHILGRLPETRRCLCSSW